MQVELCWTTVRQPRGEARAQLGDHPAHHPHSALYPLAHPRLHRVSVSDGNKTADISSRVLFVCLFTCWCLLFTQVVEKIPGKEDSLCVESQSRASSLQVSLFPTK